MDVSEQVFMGIDVSKATLEVALDSHSKTLCLSNDAVGLAQLREQVMPLTDRIGAIVLEATGGLERQAALMLCAAGLPVMVVNPRQAHDFAKAMGYLAKTDAIDARCLSHFARTLHSSERREQLLMKMPDIRQQELAQQVTRRAQLVEMRVAENNRLALAQGAPRKSILAVLKTLDRQIADIDDDVSRRLKEHFEPKLALLKGMKGLGPVTQATLMAALPELGTLNAREIAKLVGVAPLNCDSGRFKGKRTTWGGRASVRSCLYMATLSAVRYCEPIKVFYQRLIQKNKPPKVALVACMHKLLTIMNAVIKSSKPWNPTYPQPQSQSSNA